MTTHEVEHGTTVRAPAADVYRIIADVENWPLVFPPSVHVERTAIGEGEERIAVWATANGTAKGWTSRRRLDRAALRVDFRQEVSAAPVASMGGTWIVEAQDADTTRVRLLHDYRAVDDDPAGLSWIDAAVDRNSRAELAALKAWAERGTTEDGPTFVFEDTVRIAGAAKDVYDFLDQAQLWSERLPHVRRVELTEDTPGLQILEMDTVAKDGSVHTTKSVRVCFPHQRIVYKQTTLPALLLLHTGSWELTEDGDDVLATSRHTVTLNTDSVPKVLGAQAGRAEARNFVRGALSANSRATLALAKEFAEARHD
ncbi:aromatase/cyclase [Streptomyces sp. NPDC048417]|uniref:aromatase/cyclase n=1 Tax=Streptomyces sp. NPDC048417 TaxID=3155387 RepID=UPI00342B9639